MSIKFAHERTAGGNFFGVAIRIWRIAFCFAVSWLDKEAA